MTPHSLERSSWKSGWWEGLGDLVGVAKGEVLGVVVVLVL